MRQLEYGLRMRFVALRFAAAACLALLGAAALDVAKAAELVMFERASCPWCQRWNREVAPIYPKTSEGQRVPLRKVDLDRGVPSDLVLDAPVRFTPTFVLVENGREVGRLIGYLDDAAFWGLLAKLLTKIERNKG
jgi:thioredoxin-related protein